MAERWTTIPLAWRLFAMAALGAMAATAVGYAVSKNPEATPAHLGAGTRVLIIGTFVLAGVYAQTSVIQARIGLLLVAAGLYMSLWLLNGSNVPFLFSVGVLFSAAMPTLVAYLLLAFPSGHLRSRGEQRFLWLAGGCMTALWILGVLIATQPPLKTPLLQCDPHCSPSTFSLGSVPGLLVVVRAAIVTAWLALTCGTTGILIARMRSACRPAGHALAPVLLTACALAVTLVAYRALAVAHIGASTAMGAVYVGAAVAMPLAMLVGLSTERMFVADALAKFVDQLARDPDSDPAVMLAAALGDPSLRIYYATPGGGTYVDSAGERLQDIPADRTVTWIQPDCRSAAAVVYSADLVDEERFVQAAGAAVLIGHEKAQVGTDLRSSAADLAASRVRLVETADAERRRLERDLHEGVQQHLVGLRLKLALAGEVLKEDPVEAERALDWIGQQMDDVLDELRSLARGIYPSLLADRGLLEALKALARSSTIPVEVRTSGIERYPQDVEVAVYFCCLEAIQNAVKHGGRDTTATIRLWRDGSRLCFAVENPGLGFDPQTVRVGSGLVNMPDRIEAVGGTLEIVASKGRGVSLRGSVPVG